jgi:hypothetical protein
MIPQGSVPLNTTYFSNLTTSVNGAQSCSELQTLVSEAFASIGAVKSAISSELALVETLLSPPTNLAAIVTWLQTFITAYLAKPAATYATQLAALTAAIASLTSAIQAAEAKFSNCSVSIPTI